VLLVTIRSPSTSLTITAAARTCRAHKKKPTRITCYKQEKQVHVKYTLPVQVHTRVYCTVCICNTPYLHECVRHAPQQAAGAAGHQPQPIHLRQHRNSTLAGPLQPVPIRPHQQQQPLPAQRHSIDATPGDAGRRNAAAAVKLAQLLAEICRTQKQQQQQQQLQQRTTSKSTPGYAGRRDAAAAVKLAQLLAEICRTQKQQQQQQQQLQQRTTSKSTPGYAGRRDAAAAVKLAQLLAEVCGKSSQGRKSKRSSSSSSPYAMYCGAYFEGYGSGRAAAAHVLPACKFLMNTGVKAGPCSRCCFAPRTRLFLMTLVILAHLWMNG
jgi:hypothetical protein